MNDSHTHQIGTPDDPETYVSEPDGSCIVCRREAEARGDCAHCYGRGFFDCSPDEYDGSLEEETVSCYACKGTGRAAPARALEPYCVRKGTCADHSETPDEHR